MKRLLVILAVGVVGLAACGGGGANSASGGPLQVSGSTTVSPVAADAAAVLRKKGMKITIDDQGGSAGGIAQLGAGQVNVAMSSKPVGPDDKTKFPSVDFVTTQIGEDAVGIVVRREVRDGGLTSVTKPQLQALFEGRIQNWKELGGPDIPVFVYDKEPGRGTREVLDKYLYGPNGKAPPPPKSTSYAIVGGNEETRQKILTTPGAVGPLSTGFVVGQPRLALLDVDGVAPTSANIVNGSYPMARPLFLVTNGKPTAAAKSFIDFVLSAEGQALVHKHYYLTLAELGRH